MPRRRREERELPALGFNATPMVDVIFMLTIFFMLVSRFSSAEQVRMDLPNPDRSQARTVRLSPRVVINCRLAGRKASYSIGPNQPESLAVISDRLARMKQQSPNLAVVIRADRRLRYEDVRAVMREVARQGVTLLNVVAHVGEER